MVDISNVRQDLHERLDYAISKSITGAFARDSVVYSYSNVGAVVSRRVSDIFNLVRDDVLDHMWYPDF